MKYHEELFWILDKSRNDFNSDEEYQQNIDFVHSLGQKCDCVGWSELNLDQPNADEILDTIAAFCKSDRWNARGIYNRTYPDAESDWFELTASSFKENAFLHEFITTSDANGKKISIPLIRAYHEMEPTPKTWNYDYFSVPERFRNACIKHNIKGIDFCWLPDKGKYDAEQYFAIYVDTLIPAIAYAKEYRKSNHSKINALGGKLPKICSFFYRLDIYCENCYLLADMPESGIAYAYCRGITSILIHKNIAEILLQEKAISKKSLKPVLVLDSLPAGYTYVRARQLPKPTEHFLKEMTADYEALKRKVRPVRKISEKDALRVMRQTKRDRKEDFSKRLPAKQKELLLDSEYASLVPYYSVANGGFLSDEYELLSYDQAIEATQEFKEDIAKEELLDTEMDGIVFAICPDGDRVLLLKDGSVIRLNHEAPEAINQWTGLAQFVFDAVTENE